ncbi:MAG: DUF2949 domain-containing protein [Cyanobacteriota bacterium]|nr:DUF2949 domain-containing protein [Cyanobacteriota bacterium]
MPSQFQARLIQFLQQELGIAPESVQLALRRAKPIPSALPMVLWQYGLISLAQLDRIFDWLETV